MTAGGAASDGSCLHELFEAQADLRPSAPALIDGAESLSFQELDERSNRLARYLRSCGAAPGMLVGLYFERSAHPFVAMLAVLKAGAGYVPIDPDYPAERVRHILTDAQVALLLTDQSLSEPASAAFEGRIVVVDAHRPEIAEQPAARLSRAECGAGPDDLCYVIYTSGTTGRPKGVMIEHQSAVSFLSAFNEICRISPEDRVYQGFSLGFDGSVEETWMAFSTGAALVVGTREAARSGRDIARLLNERKVTVFSTVPTLLSMIEEELPTVRLLIVSGEQCQPRLVSRWAVSGRRMLNVYGPTEATVNTTAAECAPGRPITIGRPLRGYETHVVDDRLRPTPRGEPGELCIGGRCLARGYLNQPELTAERFVPNPLDGPTRASPRFYRTGDLVRMTESGDLEFLGRIDRQVKIRGFRVELSEIEAVLLEDGTIRAAAVNVFERDGVQHLAAYVVPNGGAAAFDRDGVLDLLRTRLPDYMIPGYLELMAELPTLTSGKVDRKRLPAPGSPLVRTGRQIVAPGSELERRIAAVWEGIFEVSPVSVEDDFFRDLGGHSLLAARMVSVLRNELQRDVAIRDVYGYPTIRKLAQHLASSPERVSANIAGERAGRTARSSRAVFEGLPWHARSCCLALQAAAIYLIYGVAAAPGIAFCLLFFAAQGGGLSLGLAIGVGVALTLSLYPAMLVTSIVVKWLIIGRYRPGSYPVWGLYYLRWWLVTRFQSLAGPGLLAGTPLLSIYYRLMGAKVGANCTIDTPHCHIFDLVTIGDDTSIGAETHLLGYRVENGMLMLGEVAIGSRCFVGVHSVLGLDTRMGDDARLDDLSLLADGEVIAAGESRRGSPSQPAEVSVPEPPAGASARRRPVLFGLLHVLAIYAMEAFLVLTALPILALFYVAYLTHDVFWWIALGVIAAPLYEISFCLCFAGVKAAALGRTEAGVFPLESGRYLRKWCLDSLITISRRIVLPVYTTLYLPPWLRLLGARIGSRAEVSTVRHISPDLLVASQESFFADGATIGPRRIFRGHVEAAENRIGRRSFVGNSAVLPAGAGLGDGCLIGVLSAPPANARRTPDGSEWLGSPAFQLPHHQKVGGFDETVTYRPSTKLYLQRLIVDALRILIASFIQLAAVVGFFLCLAVSYRYLTLWAWLATAPLIGLGAAVGAALCVVAVKRLLIRRFRPIVKPLWSMFVWLNEVINGAYESVAAPALAPLLGTPFFGSYLRLLGCKVGRHVFLETTLFSEFDLVDIGDYAALNLGAVIQNHLFEDRIMKASHLRIGDECSVGNMAVVLYDTEMQQGAALGPLSLLMKGETAPPFSSWHGIPTSARMGSDIAAPPGRTATSPVDGPEPAARAITRPDPQPGTTAAAPNPPHSASG